MEYLPIILIVAIFLCLLLLLRRKPKGTPQKPKPQIIPEYDSEGYNRQGYNEVGRNRQGKYNRYVVLMNEKPLSMEYSTGHT